MSWYIEPNTSITCIRWGRKGTRKWGGGGGEGGGRAPLRAFPGPPEKKKGSFVFKKNGKFFSTFPPSPFFPPFPPPCSLFSPPPSPSPPLPPPPPPKKNNVVWQLLRSWTTNKQHWTGERGLSTLYCAIKRVVLFGALKVLLKDNVSTNYVVDCSHYTSSKLSNWVKRRQGSEEKRDYARKFYYSWVECHFVKSYSLSPTVITGAHSRHSVLPTCKNPPYR